MCAFACAITISCKRQSLERDSTDWNSGFNKSVIWGNIPVMDYFYISVDNTDFSFGINSTTERVYEAYSKLVGEYPDNINGIVIGSSSDGKDIMSYSIGNIKDTYCPKTIIICAQHGFEKNSTFGTFFFIEAILRKQNDFCKFLLDNFCFLVVPVANPYGFDRFYYCNANKVNLNRNWPVIGWEPYGTPGDDNYSSENPLDQPETDAIQKLISNNLDAVLLLDFHTYGAGNVDSINEINALIIPSVEDDDYYNEIFRVAENHQERVSSLFKEKYSLSRSIFNNSSMIGYIAKCDYFRKKGCLNNFGGQNGIISLTFEGFNGFPQDKAAYTSEVAEANAILLGNFIYSFCEHYSNIANRVLE